MQKLLHPRGCPSIASAAFNALVRDSVRLGTSDPLHEEWERVARPVSSTSARRSVASYETWQVRPGRVVLGVVRHPRRRPFSRP